MMVVSTKEKLQKLLFLEGIMYSKKKDAFRIERANIYVIPDWLRVQGIIEKEKPKLCLVYPNQRDIKDCIVLKNLTDY